MNGSCPRCRTSLEIPQTGDYRCSRCRCEFRAFPVRPPDAPLSGTRAAMAMPFTGFATPPPAEGMPDAASVPVNEARCATHANNRATATCERCGDFMCLLCEVPFQGRRYCPRCYDLFLERGVVAVATGQTGNNPTTALVLGILALVGVYCAPINLVMAVAAVVLSLGVLKQIRVQPELPGRGMAISALILAALSVVVTVGYFALAAASQMRG